MAPKDKLTRLQDGDVIDTRALTEADKAKLNTLEDSEIEALISVRKKLGPFDPGQHPGGSPWFL